MSATLSDKAATFKTDIDNNKDDIKAIESAVNQNSENFGRNDEDIANLEKIVSNNTKGPSMSLLNNLTIKFSSQIPILIIQLTVFHKVKTSSTTGEKF